MATGFESLVGWRYLFRQDKRPKTLYTGLSLIAVGVLCVAWSVYAIKKSGMSLQLLGMPAGIERTVLTTGVGLALFGGVVSLFGLLYYRMTIFSAFSTFMVTIGVAEVVLVLGVMSGLHTDLRNNIISSDAHVQIIPSTAGAQIPDYKDIAKLARGVEGVTGAAPYLRTEVILDSNGNSRPAVLMGIETATIEQANKLPEQIVIGCMEILDDANHVCRHWLYEKAHRLASKPRIPETPDSSPTAGSLDDKASDEFALPTPNLTAIQDAPALLLGSELSMNLYSNVNMHVNVISPLGDLGPSGPIPRSRPFKNGGAFKSKVLKADQSLAYGSIASVQNFLGVGDVANGIQISVANLDDARPVRDRLRALMPTEYEVVDWQDRNSNLFTALEIERIVMFLVLTINILLAAFSITGTLVMTILERRREIAILMAMGSSSRSILKLFLSQGLFTGVLGSLIGATIGVSIGLAFSRLGLPLNTDVYYIDAIPVDIRISTVLAIIAVAILVSMISTVYPARFASRVNPIEGLSAE
ncbi:MAG: ABC transporter permease [Myxococcota bacterium]|nr:ABC transporter permease [Myxococcota bacterium]